MAVGLAPDGGPLAIMLKGRGGPLPQAQPDRCGPRMRPHPKRTRKRARSAGRAARSGPTGLTPARGRRGGCLRRRYGLLSNARGCLQPGVSLPMSTASGRVPARAGSTVCSCP